MRISLVAVFFLVLYSCAPKPEPIDQEAKANELAQKFIIIDGHIDVPYKIVEEWRDISVYDSVMNYDYVKATKGGLDAPFFSIYVSASYQEKGEGSSSEAHTGGAYERALALIEVSNRVAAENPDKFGFVNHPDQIRENHKKGIKSYMYGMENGAPIEGDLDKLRDLANRGIRYVTITHGKWNHLGDASYDDTKHWNGLSPFGREAVSEMNKLGVLVDISHVSDSTFYDVMEVTKVPAIASHSSCRHFTPGFERNMNDDMIKKLAENGGVIMINYGSSFVTEKANTFRQRMMDSALVIMRERGIDEGDDSKQRDIRDELVEKIGYPICNN